MKRIKKNAGIIFAISAGISYGIISRFVMEFHILSTFFGVMTIGFIFFVPLAIGVLTTYFTDNSSWPYRIFMPWVSCLLLVGVTWLIGWEGTICIVMALPVFFVMSSCGGIIGAALQMRSRSSVLAIVLILPPITSAIENQLPLPQSIREVDTQIVINADKETVWNQIKRVPTIKQEEHEISFFHLIGFPKPIEATLSKEGLGGIRHATFEGNVLFEETITRWDPQKSLSFTIDADTESIPPTTLDKHVIIGGEYFDTLEGTYELEGPSNNMTILHLSSKHRLSTHFNFYSGFWTDAVMQNIQTYILKIIKRRCETSALLEAET